MPIQFITGREYLLRPRLVAQLTRALNEGEGRIYVVVPKQYTLEAERYIFGALDIPGSFRLQVLSPERLYDRIFEESGQPEAVRVNDQGRVMLLTMAAKRLQGKLRHYKNALTKTGFPARVAAQITAFKQAGLRPDAVHELAESDAFASISAKLHDVADLYGVYESLLAGRFMDAEDEAREAIWRIPDARSFHDSEIFMYGFDLISDPLQETFLALERIAKRATLLLALSDDDARDAHIFEPVAQSFSRLRKKSDERGITPVMEALRDDVGAKGDLRHLERELFAWPYRPYPGESKNVHLWEMRDPKAEAELAAAYIRDMAMHGGYRYSDFAVACQDLGTYDGIVTRAFALYGVPVFLSESRPADRHPLALCLLSALRCAVLGFQADDVERYIGSGFAPVTDDEADLIINYARECGLRGRAWRSPLTRGKEAQRAAAEPIREKAVRPLSDLQAGLRSADNTLTRLTAVYRFLEDSRMMSRMEAEQRNLIDAGYRGWAAEGAQVWTRIIGALDQMASLLEGDLRPREILLLLEQALASTEIKALPQSGDAVSCGGIDHMKSMPVKALILLGLNDAQTSPGDLLLSGAENKAIADETHAFLGLDAVARGRMNRLSVKSLLSIASDRIILSYAISNAKGEALRPGAIIKNLRKILPGQKPIGEKSDGEWMRTLLLNAERAAARDLSRLLGDAPEDPLVRQALASLSRNPKSIAILHASLSHAVHSESIPPMLAASIYGGLTNISASRLERYARCPFQHFTYHGLRPAPFEEFKLSRRDIGSFYHEAVERFMRGREAQVLEMTPDEAAREMDLLMDELSDKLLKKVLPDDAVTASDAERLRDVAKRAARMIVTHLEGSRFTPCDIEVEFGDGGAVIAVGDAALHGRIDRVDIYENEGDHFLRVIDYKTGGKDIDLSGIYHGLQLQLMIYIAAAAKKLSAVPAGAFYFSLSDPLLTTDARDPDEVERMRGKELRMNGLILDAPEIISAMATSPENVMNVAYNSDGSFRKNDNLLCQEDFRALVDHTTLQAGRMIEAIRGGATSIQPAEHRKSLSCAYCDYRDVCHIDPLLPGSEPRRLKTLRAKDAIELARAENP